LAITELVGGFAEQFPDETDEILFGASALLLVEREFSDALLSPWKSGKSSLRDAAASLASPERKTA
jgi:hypothetical protein